MTTLIIACVMSASLGCIFGFFLAALFRSGSDEPTPTPPNDRSEITLGGIDKSALYDAKSVDKLLQLMEQRCADGRVLKIKVA